MHRGTRNGKPRSPGSALHDIHVHDGISEDEPVGMRMKRDTTLEMPTLILPSIQVNIRDGAPPPAKDNGVAYLRIPLNVLPAHRH